MFSTKLRIIESISKFLAKIRFPRAFLGTLIINGLKFGDKEKFPASEFRGKSSIFW